MPRETEGLPRDGRALHELGLLRILQPHNQAIISIRLVINVKEDGHPSLEGHTGCYKKLTLGSKMSVATRLSAKRLRYIKHQPK
ncbi:hypothetical protein F4781DRAFT_385302 [Annulohypoxylon bovei var. microspora]|nr:hypothetical protein F4781DRAFT_385302 [Annulohypoxylon bovei var. microspora]